MPSKAEQNKLCVVVIEQTLPYLEAVVICRKSVAAASEQVDHTASPDPLPTVSPCCYFAVFKTTNCQQPLQNLLDLHKETQGMLMVLLKERIPPQECQTPLDTQNATDIPKGSFLHKQGKDRHGVG